MCMGPPAEERRLLRVIVGVVVLGWQWQPLGHIPLILGIQRILIVLRVAGNEDLPPGSRCSSGKARLVALGKDAQSLAPVHVRAGDAGAAAVGA